LQLFKEYPATQRIIISLSENVKPDRHSDQMVKLGIEQTVINEQKIIKALFGRDIIGKYNKKIVDSL